MTNPNLSRSIRYRERKLEDIQKRQQALYYEQQELEESAHKLSVWLNKNRPYVPLEDPVAEEQRKDWARMAEKWDAVPMYVMRQTNPIFSNLYEEFLKNQPFKAQP